MKKMIKISVRETITLILISFTYGMFAFFSLNTFFLYRQELTGINQWLEPVDELQMPTITVCSQEVFKNVSKNTTTEMLLENLNDYVFAWEDLFDERFTELHSLFWNPHREIFSKKSGVCYSLNPKVAAKPGNSYLFYIIFPVGLKYQVCFF